MADSISRSGAFGLAKSLENQLVRQVLPKAADRSQPVAAATPAVKSRRSLIHDREHRKFGQRLAPGIGTVRRNARLAGAPAATDRGAAAPMKCINPSPRSSARVRAIQRARARREECRAATGRIVAPAEEIDFCGADFAAAGGLPACCSVLAGQENNDLLARVRQRARQNHLRLSRSIELMQGLINSLFPAARSRAFTTARGRMKLRRVTRARFTRPSADPTDLCFHYLAY